jgi:hypothetical protein
MRLFIWMVCLPGMIEPEYLKQIHHAGEIIIKTVSSP